MAPLPPETVEVRPAGSFQRAVLGTAVATIAAIAAMAVVLVLGLNRADDLLARLRRSQDQLAAVTRIQADVERLRADVLTGAPGVEDQMRRVEADLAAYRVSVRDEGLALGSDAGRAQVDETRNAERMATLFAALRPALLRDGGAAADAQARARFGTLTNEIAEKERAEARQASRDMAELRGALTWLGVAIPSLVGLVAAAGAWVMLARVTGALRRLEAAAAPAGGAEFVGPVPVAGFAEFRRLAEAFNRMRERIAQQHAILEAANQGLENEVRERTAEIEASRQALAEIDANRRLFFSKVGHELRTPVTVVRGEAEVALRDAAASPERLREALQVVAAHAGFLQRRLEDLLTLARAEDGRLALRRERVDVSEVTRQAVALAEPFVRASGLSLEAEFDAAGGGELDGDASWLQQAILALVDNAAKFADDGAPIRLTLARERARTRITVADRGPGVAADDLPRLFESGYQTPEGRARGGSGLGLAVARWVVEEHGGEIHAQRSAGRGLTIHIDLPVRA